MLIFFVFVFIDWSLKKRYLKYFKIFFSFLEIECRKTCTFAIYIININFKLKVYVH